MSPDHSIHAQSDRTIPDRREVNPEYCDTKMGPGQRHGLQGCFDAPRNAHIRPGIEEDNPDQISNSRKVPRRSGPHGNSPDHGDSFRDKPRSFGHYVNSPEYASGPHDMHRQSRYQEDVPDTLDTSRTNQTRSGVSKSRCHDNPDLPEYPRLQNPRVKKTALVSHDFRMNNVEHNRNGGVVNYGSPEYPQYVNQAQYDTT